jgi:hypothetical protein
MKPIPRTICGLRFLAHGPSHYTLPLSTPYAHVALSFLGDQWYLLIDNCGHATSHAVGSLSEGAAILAGKIPTTGVSA